MPRSIHLRILLHMMIDRVKTSCLIETTHLVSEYQVNFIDQDFPFTWWFCLRWEYRLWSSRRLTASHECHNFVWLLISVWTNLTIQSSLFYRVSFLEVWCLYFLCSSSLSLMRSKRICMRFQKLWQFVRWEFAKRWKLVKYLFLATQS